MNEGSFASATAAHEVFDVASFADFEVAPDATVPTDLTISFSVTVDGAPATAAAFGRAYFTDGTTRTSLTDRFEGDPDAVPPVPPSLFFVNNGDGTYSVRIEGGVAEFGATNGRYLVVVETGANELEIAAVGDYPARDPARGPGQQRILCRLPRRERRGWTVWPHQSRRALLRADERGRLRGLPSPRRSGNPGRRRGTELYADCQSRARHPQLARLPGW